jgi:hypothetical protein
LWVVAAMFTGLHVHPCVWISVLVVVGVVGVVVVGGSIGSSSLYTGYAFAGIGTSQVLSGISTKKRNQIVSFAPISFSSFHTA